MLRAKKRWPEAYDVVAARVRAIAAEFGVPVKDVLYQLALARGDTDVICRAVSNRSAAISRRCWPTFSRLYNACLLLALDLELLDGVTPKWRNWRPSDDGSISKGTGG